MCYNSLSIVLSPVVSHVSLHWSYPITESSCLLFFYTFITPPSIQCSISTESPKIVTSYSSRHSVMICSSLSCLNAQFTSAIIYSLDVILSKFATFSAALFKSFYNKLIVYCNFALFDAYTPSFYFNCLHSLCACASCGSLFYISEYLPFQVWIYCSLDFSWSLSLSFYFSMFWIWSWYCYTFSPTFLASST